MNGFHGRFLSGPCRGCVAVAVLAAVTSGRAAAPEGKGAYPSEIASWTEETKDAQRAAATALLARFKAAAAEGRKRFRIPPGQYRFDAEGTPSFRFEGVQDMEIEAQGAVFWFDGRFRIDAVNPRKCRNVTIRGLTVDYDPMPYAQGPILEMDTDTQTVLMRVQEGFPVPDAAWTEQAGKVKIVVYDPAGVQRVVRMDWLATVRPEGPRTLRLGFKFGWLFRYDTGVRVGDTLVLPDRSKRMAFMSSGCEGMVYEDITVYACPQMAFTEALGGGGNVYRRCRVVPRPGTVRTLACNADVFHSTLVERGPRIEHCEFSHAADDFVNIHGFFSIVARALSPTELVIVMQFTDRNFGPGSLLRFYDFEDLTARGAARVASMDLIAGDEEREKILRMEDEIRETGARFRGFHPPERVYPFRVLLDSPLSSVDRFDLVGCDEKAGNGAVVRGN